MTTVPGTYFTKGQLEAALKVDNVSGEGYSGSGRMNHYGYDYHFNKKQYDKALACYILATMENNSNAQCNIGVLYHCGYGVPQNYLCALKWYLKAAEGIDIVNTPKNIGILFEYGYGVPLDKYKALEWYCHAGDKTLRDKLKNQGFHLSAADMIKPRQQLRKETEAILDDEKKKLEWKQHKTQEEREALVDLNITYKLTGGSQNAWNDVPILLATSKQRYTESLNSSVTHNNNEILELKKQIQLLKQERSTFENQAKQLQSLKQEESNLQLEINERDRQLTLLRNDFQLVQHKNVTFQQQIKTKDDKTTSLQREIQELQLKTNSLEQQVREKDSKITKSQKKIKRLERSQDTMSSRKARPSTVPESIASNTVTSEDDPNNDFNYDTPSEDGDRANDLNYDSDV